MKEKYIKLLCDIIYVKGQKEELSRSIGYCLPAYMEKRIKALDEKLNNLLSELSDLSDETTNVTKESTSSDIIQYLVTIH